jgi:hypothetical protein
MQSFLSTSTLITLLALTSPFLPLIHAAKPASLSSTSSSTSSAAAKATGSSSSTDSLGSTGSSSGSLDSGAWSQSSSSSSAITSSSTAAAKSQWCVLVHPHLMKIGSKSTHQWEKSHLVPPSCSHGLPVVLTVLLKLISYQPQQETSSPSNPESISPRAPHHINGRLLLPQILTICKAMRLISQLCYTLETLLFLRDRVLLV